MDLNKENMRKIRELIVFTIVILIGLWKYTLIVDFLGFILNIIFPFLLGGAIAFILNVPMSFLESKIFGNDGKDGKPGFKYARPCSLTLTILCVIGVIVLVMFVVIPQLGSTFMGLGKTIQDFTPVAMAWVEEIFHNNQEIMALLEDLNMDWDKILDGVAAFFKNGAGSVLDTTMSAAKSIISSVTTFFIAFVFSCYILLQKEKLRVQVQKIFYAGGSPDCVYGADPDLRGIYRMRRGGISDPDGGSGESINLCGHVPGAAAGGRQPDLPQGGRQFRGASLYMGAGRGQHRRQPDGRCGNARIHPAGVRGVYPVPWGRV